MRPLHITALVLVIIGALNWGLVGLFQFDLVAAIFGGVNSPLSRIIYVLVGLAGLVLLATSTAMYAPADRRRPITTTTPPR